MNSLYRLGLFAVLVLVVYGELPAQQVDVISANPQVQQLRTVWQAGGKRDDDMSVGGSMTLTDGTVVWYASGQPSCTNCGWYRWDRDGDSARQFQGIVPFGGCTGRFFGTDERYLATYGHVQYATDVYASRILLNRYVDSSFDTTAITIWDGATQNPVETEGPWKMVAADLDGDNAEELLALYRGSVWPVFDSTGQLVSYGADRRRFIMIFKGGSDFSLATPTVILREPTESYGSGPVSLLLSDFNGDARPDIGMVANTATGRAWFRVWMSRPGSPWNLSAPDTTVTFPDAHAEGLEETLVLHDADGDGQLDCLYPIEPFSLGQHAQFLSRTGGSFLQRLDSTGALHTNRADRILQNTPFDGAVDWGYISDSTERYAVLGFLRRGNYIGLSGGPNGPDASWDVTASGANWMPIGDATGDGWNDLLDGYPFSGANQGYAALHAGGPYIPHDATVGVEWTAVAGDHAKAIATWPNPAAELVHIAWRGDLHRMPRSFRIHDGNGVLVAEGSVSAGSGEALWNCADRPNGTYTCSIRDAAGTTIAIARLLVQH